MVILATANEVDFRAFTGHVDTAIGRLNGYMNQVGIDQRLYLVKK